MSSHCGGFAAHSSVDSTVACPRGLCRRDCQRGVVLRPDGDAAHTTESGGGGNPRDRKTPHHLACRIGAKIFCRSKPVRYKHGPQLTSLNLPVAPRLGTRPSVCPTRAGGSARPTRAAGRTAASPPPAAPPPGVPAGGSARPTRAAGRTAASPPPAAPPPGVPAGGEEGGPGLVFGHCHVSLHIFSSSNFLPGRAPP